MGEPKAEVVISSAGRQSSTCQKIKSVRMLLATSLAVRWQLKPDALKIIPPSAFPCEHAVVFKIERAGAGQLEKGGKL